MPWVSTVRWVACGLVSAIGFGAIAPSAQATTDAVLMAQIIADPSLGTRVNGRPGSPSISIDQGSIRGTNLFHSFQEFNINTGQTVEFLNPIGIENIFSRVIGGEISEIDGVLGVDGAASLFLLNPNGIVFGPNAELNVNGSFTARAGESFRFADGSTFSAINPQGTQFLTMSAPMGVQLGDSLQGNIEVNGATLQLFGVDSDLKLSGLSILVENAILQQPGGGDIVLETPQTEGSFISVTSPVSRDVNTNPSISTDSQIFDGGDIQITAHDFSVQNAVVSASTSGDASSGQVRINASNTITINGGAIGSAVDPGALGDSKGIDIKAATLTLQNNSLISTSTLAAGDSGRLQIITENTNLDGDSRIVSQVERPDATGDSGGISINTNSLTLQNGSFISASTFGFGSSGRIEIVASENISLSTQDSARPSRIVSQIEPSAADTATSGDINITTGSLSLRGSLSLQNVSDISTNNFRNGEAASIAITASERIELERSFITSGAFDFPDNQNAGNAGNISIKAGEVLLMRNDSLIGAGAENNGKGGFIDIEADFLITDVGENNDILAEGTGGDGGRIDIQADRVINFQEVEEFDPDFEPRKARTNDISAQSGSGVDGEVNVENLRIDPNQGLTELPPDPINPADQIARSCGIDDSAVADDSTGEFTVTGRGGQPLTPADIADASSPLVDLGSGRIPFTEPLVTGPNYQHSTAAIDQPQLINSQGAVRADSGEVFLVAAASWQTSLSCSSLRES